MSGGLFACPSTKQTGATTHATAAALALEAEGVVVEMQTVGRHKRVPSSSRLHRFGRGRLLSSPSLVAVCAIIAVFLWSICRLGSFYNYFSCDRSAELLYDGSITIESLAATSSQAVSDAEFEAHQLEGAIVAENVRRLLADTPALPPWQKHTIMLLDSHTQPVFETDIGGLHELRRHPQFFTFIHTNGSGSEALARGLDLRRELLPLVVYEAPHFVRGPRSFQGYSVRDEPPPLGMLRFFQKSARHPTLLANDADREVCFNLVEASEDMPGEAPLACLLPGQREWMLVRAMSSFIARYKDTGTRLAKFQGWFPGVFVVRSPDACDLQRDEGCRVQPKPYPTDPETLTARAALSKQRVWRNTGRDPALQSLQNLTNVGFVKRRAPDEVVQALSSYMQVNNGSWVEEQVPHTNVVLNHYEAPPLTLPFPTNESIGWHPLHARVSGYLQMALSEWAGVPLIDPAIVGIRVYTRGAMLAPHMDDTDQHLVSAIINVDQNSEQPWPLQITDHTGMRHNIEVAKGEMVMYEGAKCVHGREQPFQGRYHANLMVHFRPNETRIAEYFNHLNVSNWEEFMVLERQSRRQNDSSLKELRSEFIGIAAE